MREARVSAGRVRGCRALVVASEYVKQDVIVRLRVPPEKVHVVYWAPARNVIRADGGQLVSNKTPRYVLAFGSANPATPRYEPK